MSDRTKFYSLRGKRAFVAGHRGMVGSAILRRLAGADCEVLTASREELDLRDQRAVGRWMDERRPHAVIATAAKVGGILANSLWPADFLYENLMIEANLVEAARLAGVEKLLLLGSSCIYPRLAPQPIPEAALLTGPLEPTNQWYAIAKIAGIMLIQAYRRQYGLDFIAAMPTNLYGPGDNFDLETSHVIPALMRKAHEAKTAGAAEMVVWGSGAPRREFLHVDDCASACLFLLEHYSGEEHINVGTGEDLTIAELSYLIAETVGFKGHIAFDGTRPDGTPRKLLDVSRIEGLGWRTAIGLRDGIADTYRWFVEHGAGQRRPGG